MKYFFRVLLVGAICLMAYLCVDSIMRPIRFDREKAIRDQAVIQRLIDIRTAQVAFKNTHGMYADDFDTLINFVKYGELPFVLKEGVLNDKQLEDGLTEWEAARIVQKGNQREIKKWGLEGFRRETTYVNVKDTLFGASFAADSLRYVPFARNNEQFELRAGDVMTGASGLIVRVFEARTPLEVYLVGMDPQEVLNLRLTAEKLGKYPGLMVGNIFEANNNAGNWE
ncbi:MAG: hypothetical protein ILP04_07505 [Bacteroidales bacterium]|nr:hypothetical protein [Bacteroidales bacterium]